QLSVSKVHETCETEYLGSGPQSLGALSGDSLAMVLKTFLRFSLSVLFFSLLCQTIFAQGGSPILQQNRAGSAAIQGHTPLEKSPEQLNGISADIAAKSPAQQQGPETPGKRSITISDAVSIFLQQNLQLVAARYDIDTVDAEKLTARLRPNPEISVGFSDIPLDFRDNFVKPQTFSYDISQTFELGGKRSKRIAEANANSEVAQAEFQTVLWQLTNDVKRKFYAVLLAESLLKLAQANQGTFAEIVDHTKEVFQLGEISGLDLQRVEIEKFKFDTDVANSERDYELALRDLRVTLGGDYRAMDIEAAGSIDY